LAISMSVGLLLISFLFDLYSYDKFHENGERIFRITSEATFKGEQGGRYASASVRAGRLIREKVSGVEQVTIVRNDFEKDAVVAGNFLPVNGLWAEPSIFKIFSFQVLEGNVETALRDPYSVVLTETAAKKLFGSSSAMGKSVKFDSIDFHVTGVMKDVPFFSHVAFEALVSFSTISQSSIHDRNFDAWSNLYPNSIYVLLRENVDRAAIQAQLNTLASEENKADDQTQIQLELLPLYDIVVGENLRSGSMRGSSAPHIPLQMLWLLVGLAVAVVLSACFNYTNLSIARAMRRFKEIGLRKAIGARKNQVQAQFFVESIMISLLAFVLAYFLFVLLRPQLIRLVPEMQQTVQLNLSAPVVVAFILFSIIVGIIAGIVPALYFSKISAIRALGNLSVVKVFKHITLQRALVVIQNTVTLIFITITFVGYVQYKSILAFDLGFDTENILNINMQGNKPDALLKELGEIPEVSALSRSLIVTSVGNAWGGHMKFRDSQDSTLVLTNHVDENYLALHGYKLIAGGNFVTRPASPEVVSEVIVNEQVLKRFNIHPQEPAEAIGKQITFNSYRIKNSKMTIVGVMKDFHYGKLDNLIEPVAFMPWTPVDGAIINVKLQGDNLPAIRDKIASVWKKIDRFHPFKAEFYRESIEVAYSEYSMMIKIMGFLSFLTISIATIGMLGMVVFSTETRLKEISIRKVMGARSGHLIYLLSRGFVALMCLSALIALPATHYLFEQVLLAKFPYHTPVQLIELMAGFLVLLFIALILLGSLTFNAVRRNPIEVLKID
jgi:putative ABC transport system permease protein